MSTTCVPCGLSWEKASQADTHRRCVHQMEVSVTTAHGDEVDLARMEDSHFHCPNQCGYSNQNAGYLGGHVKNCLSTGPRPAPIARHVEHNAGVLVPADEEVHCNELLGEYLLAWNDRCQILICTACHAGVLPEEVAKHLKTHRNESKVKRGDVLDALKEYLPQVNHGPRPLDYVKGKPQAPLEGLLVYNGYTCKICDRSWPALKSVQNHFGKNHRDLTEQRDNFIQSDKCQHLYGHSHSLHFPVLPYVRPAVASGPGMRSVRTPSPEIEDNGDTINKLLNKLEAHALEGTRLGPDSESEKDAANWLFVSGIQTYIEGLIAKEKAHDEIVEAVVINENVDKMVPFLVSWINKTMKRLHQTGQMLKRVCLAEDEKLEDNKGLMPLQEKASVIKYARILANFLWFLVLQTDSPVDACIQLYNVHKPFIRQLRDMILPLEPPRQNVNQYGAEEIVPVDNPDISNLASRLLCMVFQVPAAARDCQYHFPPMQFLAFSVVKADGSYEEVNTLTRLIAGMQYGVRLAFAQQYLDTPAPAFDPDADPTLPFKDDFSKFKYLHKNHAGPFNYVRQVMHLATTAIMSEALPETTFWADHHQETLEVDNKKVTIGGIRNCIQIQDKLVQQDIDAIVRGCKMPKLDLNLYKDKPNNRSPGTNYLTHSRLTHRKYNLHILKEWVRKRDVHGLLEPRWREQLGDEVSVCNPAIWKTSAVWKWLEMYDRIVERLYFLYHVASGQPLRGTEESALLLVNTRLAARNIYLRDEEIAFVSYYHKSRNVSGKNKPRMTFLPAGHTEMWHTYLGFLRPVAIFFLNVVGKPHIASDMTTKVWVTCNKGALDTEDFSNILKRRFIEGGVAPLGISQWRHVSVAITDAHIKIAPPPVPEGENSMFDCQRGHSSKTANTAYGGTGGYEVDRNSEIKYKLVSEALHKFWNIDSVFAVEYQPPVPVESRSATALLKDALKIYVKEGEPTVRSKFQGVWLKRVFERRHDMLVVARTGGGKSLAYMLPPLVELTGLTLIVQPLTALVQETADMYKENGVEHMIWRTGKEIPPWCRAVVCTTEMAGSRALLVQLEKLKVNRVIIDEAHCYEDDEDYRKYAASVTDLRLLECPFIFMTATMQVGHEGVLFRMFCVHNVIIEREPTGRPELQWAIVNQHSDPKNDIMPGQVAKVMTSKNLAERDRTILFLENIEWIGEMRGKIEELHPDHPTTVYHSKLTPEEKIESVTKWKNTPRCTMIATSGFGAGVNYKHVRHVMIAGLPEDSKELNRCFQEAGRAGRDEKQAYVWLFQRDKPEKGSFGARLMDKTQCIPATFGHVLDGLHRTCADIGCSKVCWNCKNTMLKAAEKRKVVPEEEEPAPGTLVMYKMNSKKAKIRDDLVRLIGLTISKIRKGFMNECGWCLAVDGTRVQHGRDKCPGVGKKCARCYEDKHFVKDCVMDPISAVIKRQSKKASFLCEFCGLGEKYDDDKMHIVTKDAKDQKCFSGLQNVCERYCWYFYRQKKSMLCDVVVDLDIPSGSVMVAKSSQKEFHEWLGCSGWLGCPWANMVTLFMVLRHDDIRMKM